MEIRQDVIEQEYNWTAQGIATQLFKQNEYFGGPDGHIAATDPFYLTHGTVFECDSDANGSYRFIVIMGSNLLFIDDDLDTYIVSAGRGMTILGLQSGIYARHIHELTFILEKAE